MSGVYEVECEGCGRRHETSAEQARKQRVVRCGCGQFVRLDRALIEHRSEPAPAPAARARSTDEVEEEEATHMLSSLSAVAALAGRNRATQVSIHDDSSLQPTPHRSLRSISSVPPKHSSAPPTDKPLWYVDLGGSRTVEMTIEQLIVARRSGKLGEGALVWRDGMPRWRPVGELIPATSVATRTPLPPAPSAPSRPPPAASSRPPAPLPSRPAAPSATRPPTPSRSAEAAPQSLASYERPLATLEFALERPEATQPAPATHSPLPGAARSPSRPPPPRSLTPLPRSRSGLSAPAYPVPAALSAPNASARPPAPAAHVLPPPSPLPAPRVTPIPTPLPSFTSDRPVETPIPNATWDWLGDRPRWVSACIALAVCIAASGSGAYLVRSLKMHRQPLALTPAAAEQPLAAASTAPAANRVAPSPSASAPLVVDLQSLSVEHSAPRRVVRAVPRPMPVLAKPALESETAEPSEPTNDTPDDSASTPSQSTRNAPKSTEPPGVGQPATDTLGSDNAESSERAVKKPSASGNDD